MILKDAANEAYQIAVEECGAGSAYRKRMAFVSYVTDGNMRFGKEWRFGGALGFGGKLCYDPRRGFRVTAYSEDQTYEVDAMIHRANTRLADLRVEGEVES